MSRKTAITAAVVLVLAGALGLLLFPRGGDSEGSPQGHSSPGARANYSSGPAVETQPDSYFLEGRLAHDDDPVGEHRLEGQVLDAEDRPVDGATVVIDSNPRRELRTEADGSFVFDKLMARSYRIEARSGDAVAGPVRTTLSAGSDPIVLRLRAAASLRISVFDAATKEPIADALVELRGLAVIAENTDSEGRAHIVGVGAGILSVKVSAAGYASNFQLITSPGTANTLVERKFGLRPGVVVSGSTVDAAGQPVEGARVWAQIASAREVAIDPRLEAVLTDAKGRWRLAGLPQATVRFRAGHTRFAPSTSHPVALDNGLERSGVNITMTIGARVAGRVLDQNQTPVSGAVVRVGGVSMHTELVRRTYSDASGSFEVVGLPRLPMQLVASTDNASSPMVAVNLQSTSEALDVVIPLDGADQIRGVVVTSSGKRVPEARIVANPEITGAHNAASETRLRGEASVVADAEGGFTLVGLRPGNYRLRAIAPGAPASVLSMRQGAMVKSDATAVELVVDDLTSAQGIVSFADGSHPEFFSVTIGNASPLSFASTEGKFSASELPAGTTYVRVVGPDLVTHYVEKIELKAGDDNDLGKLQVQRGRRVSGRVLGPSGAPVEGAMIYASPEIEASGDSIASFWEASDGIKRVFSGEDGAFVVKGLGSSSQVIVADHPSAGRSQLVALPKGLKDVTVELRMGEVGSLEGRIMINGEPVAGGVGMRADSAADAQFSVAAGPDGQYRFDRLSPGRYIAYAWFDAGRKISGGEAHTAPVVIKQGQTSELNFKVEVGDLEVTLHMTSEGDAVKFGYGVLVTGFEMDRAISMTVNEARALMSTQSGQGSIKEGMIVDKQRITFVGVTAGKHGACISPLGADPRDPAALQAFQKSEVEQRMYCVPLLVAKSPAKQEFDVMVQAP